MDEKNDKYKYGTKSAIVFSDILKRNEMQMRGAMNFVIKIDSRSFIPLWSVAAIGNTFEVHPCKKPWDQVN